MKPVAGDIHLVTLRRYFQCLKNANTFPDVLGPDPAGGAREVDLF